MDMQKKRIMDILGEECDTDDTNFIKYYNYLKDKISMPCLLTGIEDFPWEERYLLGGGSQTEYKKLKQDNPSFTDIFELIELVEPDGEEDDLFVLAERVSDKKIFDIGLSWLKCTDSKSKNYQLLDDFAVWQCNY